MTNQMSDLEKLNQELTWLRMEVKQLREEDRHFSSESPFISGTDWVPTVVPPIAPFSLRATVSSSSMAGYLVVADGWIFVLNHFIKENSTVLDIGCGCGKMARLLVMNPNIKRYIGFDNYQKSIEWCREHIVPFSKGSFEFHYLDVFSKGYNPTGKTKATDVVFPADDHSVDFVFAASLFTHLLEDDARHYLKEVRRVLKRDGGFLPSIHTEPEEGKSYSGTEIRIDVLPDYFIQMASEAGLALEERLGQLLGQEIMLFA